MTATPVPPAPPAPPRHLDAGPVELDALEVADADALAAAVAESMAHLLGWMPWAGPEAAAADFQRRRIAATGPDWASGPEYIYALRVTASPAVIGTFGLHRRIGPAAIEIGYWLHVGHTGRGYATAAAAALTDAAFGLPDIERVEIHTDEANLASAAIPQRLGYRLARVEVREPQAPSESGRLQIWAATRPR